MRLQKAFPTLEGVGDGRFASAAGGAGSWSWSAEVVLTIEDDPPPSRRRGGHVAPTYSRNSTSVFFDWTMRPRSAASQLVSRTQPWLAVLLIWEGSGVPWIP